ncbi:MAG: threonine ammonia-lyase [Acidilobaceae archaeon]|nr:threonine ammonia-lyase [Acidilobaceae archaeon]
MFDRLWQTVVEESERAREVVGRYAHRTPVGLSSTLSRIAGGKVILKYENLQKTGSFKVRGALYKVSQLRGKVSGVVAASAGNHAQGVAYASSVFGMKSVIVMPETASISKIEATRSYGAEVVLHGRVYDEALEKALEIARERGYEFIPAFDDVSVIAGQGTICWELLEQAEADMVVVPVGGGGLIAGVAGVMKRLRPDVKVIGVEPEAAPKMLLSLRAGKPVSVEPKPSVADGLITKRPGELTFTIASHLVDEIVTVDEEELSQAIYFLLERKKALTEGAGAAGVAALLAGKLRTEGKRVVIILSGGNIDLTLLHKILMRGLSKVGRIVRLSGYVPDYPGQLKRVLEIVASKRANVLDILHDRVDVSIPPWHAKVVLLLEVPSLSVAEEIVEQLAREGYSFSLERGSRP